VTVGAIAAAVGNAVGAFVPEMPMSPWKMLRVIRSNATGTKKKPGTRPGSS